MSNYRVISALERQQQFEEMFLAETGPGDMLLLQLERSDREQLEIEGEQDFMLEDCWCQVLRVDRPGRSFQVRVATNLLLADVFELDFGDYLEIDVGDIVTSRTTAEDGPPAIGEAPSPC